MLYNKNKNLFNYVYFTVLVLFGFDYPYKRQILCKDILDKYSIITFFCVKVKHYDI